MQPVDERRKQITALVIENFTALECLLRIDTFRCADQVQQADAGHSMLGRKRAVHRVDFQVRLARGVSIVWDRVEHALETDHGARPATTSNDHEND